MKLLYVFPEEFSGQFAREYHVYRLAESLAASGVEVILASAESPRLPKVEDLHQLFGGGKNERLTFNTFPNMLRLGPLRIRSGAWFYRELDRLVERTKPDLVFTMHVKAADHFARRHAALPLVFEAHEIFADNYPEWDAKHQKLIATERRIYEHARAVVAISDYLGECLKTRFDLRVPLRVQHDGIDESMLLDATHAPGPHELIYAGSLQPWKGVPFAIEAMRLLPEFHLTVLGGEGKSLDQIKLNAPGNVTFLGRVSREALRPHLQKAAIGLIPNLLEPKSALYTFPLKLLEYSAAGKGIVASRIPVFDRLKLDGWVELVPSSSAEDIARAVRALTERGIDRAAAQQWARQFIWAEQGRSMKNFLESVLK